MAGHVWIKYLNLETGEIQNYGYELDGSNPFYDNGKVTHYDVLGHSPYKKQRGKPH
ncbi:hypothetical protein [Campylobacter sp.]|uniref:hypothetical protein n=1 Tax=Campylobacter sp. TaxID=205 RepID=UPI002AA76A0A|nr:hypothetical protein [Campylobacter sp.]MCI7076304.1 hypothetical protein [Campylobacter sp.]